MDYLTILLLLSFLLACLSLIFRHGSQISKSSKLPPGPHPFPIIGNIMELGSKPHLALTELSKVYGPIMTLKLGTIITIVISSPHMAKEALKKNDQALSSRTVPNTACSLGHHKVSVVWLPASAKWVSLRKVCGKIFSPQQLDSTRIIRQRKVEELVEFVNETIKIGGDLDIGEAVFTTVLNSISNTFFSMDLAYYTSDKSQEFKDVIWGIMIEAGRPNIVDFFPMLRLLDPQGARARMKQHIGKLLKCFDGILEERLHLRASKMDSNIYNDFLDLFLNLIRDTQLSRHEVLHLFVDLFVAGIDTTSSTVEWAMAELICNPEKMAKSKKEIQQVLGKDETTEESHFSKFPFLHAVVKETLRLHPPASFLVPHKSINDVEIDGLIVPKNAQVLINVWAIGRDSSVWNKPNLFVPERFLESEKSFRGSDFELIPFGAGRRMCPGLPLAERTMHLILATLVHKFDWTLPNGLKPQDIDMSESYGLTLKKAKPLRAIPTKHSI